MKQVAVINNSLKMGKGKVARVCMHLGTFSSKDLLSSSKNIRWFFSGLKGVVVKTDDIELIVSKLEEHKVKYFAHVDAGRTSVPEGSLCGVVFFCEDGEFDFIEELKLL